MSVVLAVLAVLALGAAGRRLPDWWYRLRVRRRLRDVELIGR